MEKYSKNLNKNLAIPLKRSDYISLIVGALQFSVVGFIIIVVFRFFGAISYKPEIPVYPDTTYTVVQVEKIIEVDKVSGNISKIKRLLLAEATEKEKIKLIADALKDTIDLLKFNLSELGDDDNQYIAWADTTIQQDSSRIRVLYWMPPINQFDIKASIKEKIITRDIHHYYKEGFWDRIGIMVYAGSGYDLIKKDYSIHLGVGIGYKLKGL